MLDPSRRLLPRNLTGQGISISAMRYLKFDRFVDIILGRVLSLEVTGLRTEGGGYYDSGEMGRGPVSP